MKARSAIVLLLSIARAGPVQAQDRIVVSGTVTCGTCRIDLQRIAGLGRLEDDVAIHPLSTLAMDSEGRFYVASTYNPGELAMYDADGMLVRSFGRLGQGPGEFGRGFGTRLLVGPGDSIHVFEANRHSILLPDLEGFVRLQSLPFSVMSAIALPGTLVVTPMPTGATNSANLYFVFDQDGQLLRSFGFYEASGASGSYAGLRYLSRASDSTFWASHVNRPEIELWDVRGRHLITMVLDLDWFPPWVTSQGVLSPTPEPRMGGAWQDADGRLWVTISVPDPGWAPPTARRGIPVTEIDPSDVFDHVLLVVDLATGSLLTQQRFGTSYVATDGVVYAKRMSDDDVYVMDIFRPRLIR
jgi:hypothetical protein